MQRSELMKKEENLEGNHVKNEYDCLTIWKWIKMMGGEQNIIKKNMKLVL